MSLSKEDYEWYKAHGICPVCRQRDAAPNRVECDVCAEKHITYRNNLPPDVKAARLERKREYYGKLRAQRKAAGLCTRCGRKLEKYNTRTECDYCKAEQKKRDAKRLKGKGYAELGLCLWCGRERVPGYSFCPDCLERKRKVGYANIRIAREKSPWKERKFLYGNRCKDRSTRSGHDLAVSTPQTPE